MYCSSSLLHYSHNRSYNIMETKKELIETIRKIIKSDYETGNITEIECIDRIKQVIYKAMDNK